VNIHEFVFVFVFVLLFQFISFLFFLLLLLLFILVRVAWPAARELEDIREPLYVYVGTLHIHTHRAIENDNNIIINKKKNSHYCTLAAVLQCKE
jgi:hypothetical protein